MANQWIFTDEFLTETALSSIVCSSVATGSAAANAVTRSATRLGAPLAFGTTSLVNVDITLTSSQTLSAAFVAGISGDAIVLLYRDFSTTPVLIGDLTLGDYGGPMHRVSVAGASLDSVASDEYRLEFTTADPAPLEVGFVGLVRSNLPRLNHELISGVDRDEIDLDIIDQGPGGGQIVTEQPSPLRHVVHLSGNYRDFDFITAEAKAGTLRNALAFDMQRPDSDLPMVHANFGLVTGARSHSTRDGDPVNRNSSYTITEAIN